jgi:hypothetical protein
MNNIRDIIQSQLNNNHREKYFNKPENKKYLEEIEYYCSIHFSDILQFSEKIYLFINDITTYPYCLCGNKRIFKSIHIGYTRFCNTNCQYKKQSVSSKVSTTLLSKSAEDKESTNHKKKQTFIKKYGVEHPLKNNEVLNRLQETNILKYGVKTTLECEDVKVKIRNSLLDNYGVDNPFKCDTIQTKIKETNLEKYGYTSHLYNKDVRDKISNTILKKYGVENPLYNIDIQAKARNTIQSKYGVDNISQKNITENSLVILNDQAELRNIYNLYQNTSIIANKLGVSRDCVLEYLHKHSIPLVFNKFSTFHIEIKSFIEDELNIDTENNVRLFDNKEVDILIKQYNLAIECNGTYWHSEKNGKDKNYHIDKKRLYENNGIKIVYVWEHDWINKKDIIKSRLTNILGRCSTIFARKCIVKEISKKQSENFLDMTHIQGKCNSSINLGLFRDNELVSVMTFGKSRFDAKADYELLRFSSKLNTVVVGGASKLFNYFTNTLPASTTVVSYAEFDFSDGNVYKKLGFEYSHSTRPGYSYTKNYKTIYNRIKFQKNKLPKILEIYDSKLSEWDNMKTNGYDRIWNCGNKVYFWTKR